MNYSSADVIIKLTLKVVVKSASNSVATFGQMSAKNSHICRRADMTKGTKAAYHLVFIFFASTKSEDTNSFTAIFVD